MKYDHRRKAGNEGDIVKHPALVAALCGLQTDHAGLFRYGDAFAGRWDYDLSNSASWRSGIQRFATLRFVNSVAQESHHFRPG